MNCPGCGAADSDVIDSRNVGGASARRRRRKCRACVTSFTTYELPVTSYRQLQQSVKLLASIRAIGDILP